MSVFSCSCWLDENAPRALGVCRVKGLCWIDVPLLSQHVPGALGNSLCPLCALLQSLDLLQRDNKPSIGLKERKEWLLPGQCKAEEKSKWLFLQPSGVPTVV